MLTKILPAVALIVGSTSTMLADSYNGRTMHRLPVERPTAMSGDRDATALRGRAEELGPMWGDACVTDDGFGRIRPCSAN